jgi:pantoate--beta-alanine ligase
VPAEVQIGNLLLASSPGPEPSEGELATLARARAAGGGGPPPTTVHVAGLTDRLEGLHRAGHFDGVTTVVAKLLNVAQPDRAYFGEKDYQQLCVVRQLAGDLHLGCEIVGRPTVREPDGLALSSRNAYLSEVEREQALVLSQTLFAAREGWDGDPDTARKLLRTRLAEAAGVRLDYAEVCDPDTLEPLDGLVDQPARALAAVWVGDDAGATRLIDNVRLDPPPARGPPPRGRPRAPRPPGGWGGGPAP